MFSSVQLYFNNILKIRDLGFSNTKEIYTHPDRTLRWNVFLYVTQGKMEVWEGDTEYTLENGQFLFLKSGLHHWGEPKTTVGTSWYWIHFCDCLTDCSCRELNPNSYTHQELEISDKEYSIYIELPKQGKVKYPQTIEKKMDLMIKLFQSPNPFRAITLGIQTLEIFISLFKESAEDYKLKKTDNTVQKIIQYLEKKESYSLNSKELEDYLEMNYSYLCNVFKIKTGCTLHMFNSQIFINKAAIMLRSSNMNISEISDLLGFKNAFYFSRVFRKVTGCTPSEYLSRIYL